MVVYNKTQRSSDYSEIASYYRPGHADYTFDQKYGFRDYRGGGRSSGRETIGRVAGGAVALEVLRALGVEVYAYSKEIAGIVIDPKRADRSNISKQIQQNRSTARKQESVSLMDLLAQQQEDDFDAR